MSARVAQRLCLRAILVALIGILAPMWLGPLLLPIESAIDEAHHVCACGMAVGTCGCPECEQLEEERQHPDFPAYPIFKGDCGKGSPVLGAVALPPALMPAPLALVRPSSVGLLPAPLRPRLASRAPPAPPTPPPRLV